MLYALTSAKLWHRVWHPGLLAKLRAVGFTGKLLDWLTDYLKARSMKVVLNGKSSNIKLINAGRPPGLHPWPPPFYNLH